MEILGIKFNIFAKTREKERKTAKKRAGGGGGGFKRAKMAENGVCDVVHFMITFI